jgi:hypothetical protein
VAQCKASQDKVAQGKVAKEGQVAQCKVAQGQVAKEGQVAQGQVAQVQEEHYLSHKVNHNP